MALRGLSARLRMGIRARVATAAVIIVALTLIVGAGVLILLVRQSLMSGLDDTQLARAENVAAQVSSDLPTTIPTTPRQVSAVQVVDASGKVVASTANIHGEDAILAHPPGMRRDTVMTLSDSPLDQGGAFRLVAHPVTLATGPGWVYVASSVSQIDAAVNNLVTLFSVGLPIVLVVVGFTVWRAVALALRPVESIRRRASEIGAADLSQRLPVPPTRDEIARLAGTMNEMLERLELSSVRQRRFIGDASHELRSPLAGLRAQVDVALTNPAAADIPHVLGVVRDEVDRMTMLTEDLLYLARSTEPTPMTLRAPVDLDDLVLDQARRLRALGGREVTRHVEAARVSGSRRDLARLLRNLADNAYEHAHTALDLTLRTAGEMAEISVTDDGPGIPESERETVFQRFARLDEARRHEETGGGFGLGLAIAQQIARNHGGTLTVHDRPDGKPGAYFLLRLPLSDQ